MSVFPSSLKVEAPARPTFRAVFEGESSYVWNTLKRLGVRDRDLEDLTQEVFLVVFRRLGDYDPARPLRPWLFGIAYREAQNHRRRQRPVVPQDLEQTPDGAPTAEQRLALRQAQEIVLQALDAIDLDRKAILIAHDIDEQPIPAVAQELGIPLNTAYSRLRLARNDFQTAIRRIRLRRGET
jgi:RNA polymerase sigma-70 factor (ECF subfamily)